MFTLKLVDWLDEVDPYAIQRLALRKGMFMATVLVFVYWIFRPTYFSAFIMPTLIVYYYENTVIETIKEKELFLLVVFIAFAIGNTTFYLIYPFRIIFFWYTIFFFTILYYLLGVYFSQLKNITMLILAYSLFALSDEPPASFQVAYNLFFSSMLSIITMFICFRIYPNRADVIWSCAMQKYIACLEVDIEQAIQKQRKGHDADEVRHLSIVRAVRKQIPIPDLRHIHRISINIRNVQFALNNLFFEKLNMVFWQRIQDGFKQLRLNIQQNQSCPQLMGIIADTALQKYVTQCLNQAIDHWNQLCFTRRN